MADLKYGEDFWTCFDPEYYYRIFMPKEIDAYHFTYQAYHKVFQSGITGNRLLDIGTGTVPHSVISATPMVKHIYLSDYTPKNRDYLYGWLQEKSSSPDYQEVFEYFMKLENNGEQWKHRSNELKSKIMGIFPVDYTKENMLGCNFFPKFDIITTSYALESATWDAEDMAKSIKRINLLLNDGGHVILSGCLGQSYYILDKDKYHVNNVNEAEYKNMWTDAGFIIKQWLEWETTMNTDLEDYQTVFVMHCVKKCQI